VLSIGKMVAGAEDYYIKTVASGREEYYTGTGEAPGQWLGAGRGEIGLAGEVAADDLRSVLAGFAPDGRSLTAGRVRPEGRVSGFDLTYSAPKSVSLLYGLGDPATSEVVKQVHAQAVADSLGYLERRGLRARRGAGGERRIGATGFIAAGFQHRTSRSGDPQLHTHVLVANAVLGVDGIWSAPDARLLYFHARTAGFLYQAALRHGLTEQLGVRFRPVVNGTAELAGMDPVMLKAFSTRRRQIERHMDAAGTTSARAAEVAALITRGPKEPRTDIPLANQMSLRDRWRARVDDLGIADLTLSDTLFTHQPELLEPPDIDRLMAELVGAEGLCATESTFERRDAVRAVAGRLADGAPVADVEKLGDRVLASPEVVPLPSVGRGGELRHTTTELLAIESALLDRAAQRTAFGVAVVEPATVAGALVRYPFLAEEQRSMVRQLTTSGAGIEAVVGKAGSGKTTALAASRVAWQNAGFTVSGLALSARAAAGLAEGAGIPSTTIAGFLADLERSHIAMGARQVLVVDETGMVGTRALGRLVDIASEAGAKLVLVGDPRQLPEIEAGGAFAGLVERIGAIQLTQNCRQDQSWERVALDELRHGSPVKALAAFDGAERIHTGSSMADTRSQLVDAWMGARRSDHQTMMLAVNRSDVAALNDLARAALRRSGSLGADLMSVDTAGFAFGDEILCLRNDRVLRVTNGTRGRIHSGGRDGITIATRDGLRHLPPEYVSDGHLTYGYATTIHKAQGATVDRAFVLATDSLTREAGYVAMSRARQGTELFVPTSAFEDGIGPRERADGAINPLYWVEKRLAVSRAKEMATSYRPRPTDTVNDDDKHAAMPPFGLPLPEMTLADNWDNPRPRAEDRYLVKVIGRRPDFLDERRDYEDLARSIASYRSRFGIDADDDALGTRPFESIQRSAYEVVLSDIRNYQRRLGLSLELNGPSLGLSR
jgi:conjugative relaxase-like TrwC/TraI family protein